ncbi:hypothetical protein Hanom_Chr15g01368781 [Helianthus anomalus]
MTIIGEELGSIFPNSEGAKTYIPKNFYMNVLFITLHIEKFGGGGGGGASPAPRKLRFIFFSKVFKFFPE